MNLYYKIRQRYENIAWKFAFYRKWDSIFYLHRQYGYSFTDLLAMYDRSVADWQPGEVDDILGFPRKDVQGMFNECTERYQDEWLDK